MYHIPCLPFELWRKAEENKGKLLDMFSLQVDETLKLELLEDVHSDELFELVVQNKWHLDPWMPWVETTRSVDDIKVFIQNGIEQYGQRNGFQLAIIKINRIVGVVGLHYIDWSAGKTEIGYWLSQDVEGQGIMTKALKALIARLFESCKLRRIEIKADPRNHRSRAIPKRLGFLEEGILKQAMDYRDERRDQVLYSLLKEEWETE